MLKAISKDYIRVWEPAAAADAVIAAARAALSAPTGPVTLEIPVDVQRAVARRRALPARCHIAPQTPDPALLDALAAMVMRSPPAHALARRRRPRRNHRGHRPGRPRLRHRNHDQRPRRGAGRPSPQPRRLQHDPAGPEHL